MVPNSHLGQGEGSWGIRGSDCHLCFENQVERLEVSRSWK